MMSIGGIPAFVKTFLVIVFTSLKTGTPGQCRRNTFWQNASSSHSATVFIPAASAARSKPPMPEKRDSALK
jgi:hypothetical protein